MLVGEFLEYSGSTVRSYPEARQSLQATCIIDVDVVVGSPTLVASIATKNRAATTWTTIGTFSAITGTGVHKLDVSGVREQVRWDFNFTAGANGNGLRSTRSMIWRPDAN